MKGEQQMRRHVNLSNRIAVQWLVSFAFSIAIPYAAHAQMATPGQFDVTSTGAAQYTIPIAVPPGTAGMVPNLALAYNSQGGNSILGMGWGLSGLSAITRCGRTLIQDNIQSIAAPIEYNLNDRFCLDGQRLVAVNGTYGADGTEYRTERESFTKIISYGTSGSGTGPLYFKAWTKAGQIIEFGNTADSAIDAVYVDPAKQSNTDIRVWAVNKVSDTVGNYMTVTYTEDPKASQTGDYRPLRIDYTGNANAALTPYNSVRFLYQTRTDVTPLYHAGSVVKTIQRLSNVQTYAKVNGTDTMVKDYRIAYEPDLTSPLQSRIISVTECLADGTCLPGFSVGWPTAATGLILPATMIPASYAAYNSAGAQYQQLGDFNGDGETDFMWIPSGQTYWDIAYSTGAGFNIFTNVIPASYAPYNTAGAQYVQFGDFNGDGKTDFMWIPNGQEYWDVAYSNSVGNGFAIVDHAIPASIGGYKSYSSGAQWMQFGDFNGDGKRDYMWIPYGQQFWDIAYANQTGNGFAIVDHVIPASVGGYNSYHNSAQWMHIGDFNGDGKLDYMWIPVGQEFWDIAYANPAGNGFTIVDHAIPANIGGVPSYSDLAMYNQFGDFNGDGKMDYMYIPKSQTFWNIAYSTGTGFNVVQQAIPSNAGGVPSYSDVAAYNRFGDFNGDGKMNYMYIPMSQTYWKVAYSQSNSMLVSSVTTGLGSVTSLTYKPLTDNTVYSKDSGANAAAYPYMDIQAPLYVVSSTSSSNGIGGVYTNNYSYTGAKTHLWGGGFLGFHTTTVTDAQSGINSKTTYLQDYPHQGLPSSVEKHSSAGVLLNQVSNTWAYTTNPTWGNQYHVPLLTQSIVTSNDLNGAPLPTVTTTTAAPDYDACGNAKVINVIASDGYSKTTTNTYSPDPIDAVNCYLNRLTKATVTSTSP